MTRLLPFLATTLVGATPAAAQILICTDEPVGAEQNYFFETATNMSTGPLFFGVESVALAADDTSAILYVAAQFEILSWPYNSGAPPVSVVMPVDPNNGNAIRCEGMAFGNGNVYALEEFNSTGPEGIYQVDLVTADANPVYLFPDPSIDIGGLSYDEVGGSFFGTNDSTTYPAGNGIVEFDVLGAVQSETFIVGYPVSVVDVDGCAVDPAGVVYLIQDEPSLLENYDLTTMTFDPSPPLSPVGLGDTFSGGAWSDTFAPGMTTIGSAYCTANPNSTGATGTLTAFGSSAVADNDVTLSASTLPLNSFGFFIVSQMQAFTPNAGGSSGNLCVGGSIGRYVGPGQIQNSGGMGAFSLVLDLAQTPQPTGFVAIAAGESWNYQAWHRDVSMGSTTSNFTNGLLVVYN